MTTLEEIVEDNEDDLPYCETEDYGGEDCVECQYFPMCFPERCEEAPLREGDLIDG
jgi:hypothetical protein